MPERRHAGAGDGLLWRNHLRLELQKLKKIAKKHRVLVELPDIFQKRPRQAQALLKSLVKKRKIPHRHHACDCSRNHRDHRGARHRQRCHAGEKLRGVFAANQVQALLANFLSQILVSSLQVIAERKQADFARRLARGHQPIAVPGAPLERGRADAEFMLADGIAKDCGKRRQRARHQRQRHPDAIAGHHCKHRRQRHAVSQQAA
jgi:hypothetical protein